MSGDLHDLVRAALDDSPEPNPHVIARDLYGRLSEEQRTQLAIEGLAARLSLAARVERGASVDTPQAPRVGPSKWDRHERYAVAGEWKMLGDCTAEDCDVLAREREEQAERLSAWAARFRALAARMREVGAATVSDLGVTVLEEVPVPA